MRYFLLDLPLLGSLLLPPVMTYGSVLPFLCRARSYHGCGTRRSFLADELGARGYAWRRLPIDIEFERFYFLLHFILLGDVTLVVSSGSLQVCAAFSAGYVTCCSSLANE